MGRIVGRVEKLNAREAATRVAHFTIVQDGPATIDLIETDQQISSRHFAFLVSEAEFDAIFAQIEARGITCFVASLHKKPGDIDHWDDGPGVNFDDSNGHILKVITRPYGSGCRDAKHVDSLLGRWAFLPV